MPGSRVPKSSLSVRLSLLVAGTTLPLIVFAAGIVFNNYEQDRKAATQRVVDTVRSTRLVLDAEVQRMTGALQVLALTNALRDRDFEGFRRISRGFPKSDFSEQRTAANRAVPRLQPFTLHVTGPLSSIS